MKVLRKLFPKPPQRPLCPEYEFVGWIHRQKETFTTPPANPLPEFFEMEGWERVYQLKKAA